MKSADRWISPDQLAVIRGALTQSHYFSMHESVHDFQRELGSQELALLVHSHFFSGHFDWIEVFPATDAMPPTLIGWQGTHPLAISDELGTPSPDGLVLSSYVLDSAKRAPRVEVNYSRPLYVTLFGVMFAAAAIMIELLARAHSKSPDTWSMYVWVALALFFGCQLMALFMVVRETRIMEEQRERVRKAAARVESMMIGSATA